MTDRQASGERLVRVSRVAVFVWAVVMGIAMSVAQVANINVNFLITIIGARPPRPALGVRSCWSSTPGAHTARVHTRILSGRDRHAAT